MQDLKEIEEIDFDYEKPEELKKIENKTSEEKTEYVNEKLWEKLEKVGKKISFAKDMLAFVNYMRDPNVSLHRKSIVVSALIYFIFPLDAIPDIAPLIGYLDDLGVIAAVLKFLGSELIPYYQ